MAGGGQVFEYVVRFTEARVHTFFLQSWLIFAGSLAAFMFAHGCAIRAADAGRKGACGTWIWLMLIAWGLSATFFERILSPKSTYAAIVAERLVEVAP